MILYIFDAAYDASSCAEEECKKDNDFYDMTADIGVHTWRGGNLG